MRERRPIDEEKRKGGNRIIFYGTGYGNGFPDVSKAKVKLLKDGKVGIYVGGELR